MAGFSLLLAVVYAVIYFVYPFDDFVNDLILNAVYMIAVFIPAVVSSAILKLYAKGEPPRRIWLYLSVGFWVWALAELVWILYNMIVGVVPLLSL
ncbi:MAG: hypothetical protein AB1750_14950, partial [Chloroflexota bacterium]